ncbi:MAG: dTDP-glucose 4,6-dehydratase [Deltaproteobacteria bacterium]|nr:dTDP-glucose 4,6-dehydratase [Deltaproteobacteria bacterium]
MKLLVTGGAGFIGSHFVRTALRERDWSIRNFDALTYAGNLENLRDIENNPRYEFVRGDICDARAVAAALEGVDAIAHFAAETHVDRSILGARDFITTNVQGTYEILEAAKARNLRVLHMSTDEVYGSVPAPRFTSESDPFEPSSPYSASKAAGDHLALAFFRTHKLPVVVARPANNYGPFQFPEKLLPLSITRVFGGKKIPVYGDGKQVRDWLHVEDCCRALVAILERGRDGEAYNIPGGNMRTNVEVLSAVLKATGGDAALLEHVSDRPGHDRRYALDGAKIARDLNWRPARTVETEMPIVVAWYRENEAWWKRVMSGEYRAYHEQNYGWRKKA